MSAAPLSRRCSRNGLATACLVLIQLSQVACGRDRDQPAADSSGALRLVLPSAALDTLLGPAAPRVYAAMDEQIAKLREEGLAAWALLDSLGSPAANAPSSSLRRLPVILARFHAPTSGRVGSDQTTDQVTVESVGGPFTMNGLTVRTTNKSTAWDRGGKLGLLIEMTLTMTGTVNRVPVQFELQSTDRTEVKYCPDAQGISHGTRELVVTGEIPGVLSGGPRVRGTLSGYVDDEAELMRVNEDMEVKVGESSGSASRELEPVFGPSEGGPPQIDSWERGEWQRKAPNDQIRTVLRNTAIAFEGSVERAYDQARDRWRDDHRCVEVAFLEGDKRRSVAPGDRVRIVAEARHKEDGGKLPAPLEASLFAYQSITPDRKRIPPPAEFTYQAPDDGTEQAAFMREKGTTVRVTSTSRRGIGESIIEYRLGRGPSYQVKMQVRQQAEKLGTTYDVTYEAKLEPGPDGELQGSGSYRGTELSWKVACSDVDQDPNAETHPVSGKLKATGSAVDVGGNTMLMFSLETVDFPPPPGWSGEVDPEVKGRGTVGNLGLTLTGPLTSKTVKGEGDLMGFSAETPCTGKFSNTQETTVQLVQ